MRSIPFLPRFHDDVRSGRKTLTARTKRYGAPGDLLQGPGCVLRLVEVGPMPLAHVAESHFSEEGCESPDEFRAVWTQIHPRRGWEPHRLVHLHRFEVVPTAEVTP